MALHHKPQALGVHDLRPLPELLRRLFREEQPVLYLVLLVVLPDTLRVLSELHRADALLHRRLARTEANEEVREGVAVVEAWLEEMSELAVAVRDVRGWWLGVPGLVLLGKGEAVGAQIISH